MIDVTINRERGIGGSDTYALMRNDWHNLWLLKTKRKSPPNLNNKLAVQIGIATEHVNEKFLQKKLKLDWQSYSGVLYTSDAAVASVRLNYLSIWVCQKKMHHT
mgnify:CR=1 FL=1